jgi:hypothetical protein
METLKGIFGTAKDSSTEATRPKAIERTPSGTKKWIKELSPLANSVVGRCARYTNYKPTNQPTNQRLMLLFFFLNGYSRQNRLFSHSFAIRFPTLNNSL